MSELTCGSCRNSPATHLIVADLGGLGGLKTFRVERLTCKPCADSSARQVRPGDHVRLYCLVPDGESVTEWGLRYESDDGGDVVMPYPLLDVQQLTREFPPGLASSRTAVARQAGPWAEAEVPASVGCRHCAGTIIPCEPRHDHPACLGWKHAAWLSMSVGAHYCEGRSVNPSAEPGEDEGDE
jgi:hypothetical protein